MRHLLFVVVSTFFFFFKQKTAYEMVYSDWSSDVCSSDLRGLLLAHHPLLLRGVDTVAASTAKGALLHRMIRTGRALFTAHTNADSAAPGVSDALADALGLTVQGVLAPAVGGQDNDKWVVFVPAGSADEVREA